VPDSAASNPAAQTPAAHHGALTDDGLYQLISVGVLVGTPVLFVTAVVISYLSGVGMGNALAIAIIPALFGGVTFGGFVGLMRHLRREDQADAAARAARRVVPMATGEPTVGAAA
jgi:hypothetical protein